MFKLIQLRAEGSDCTAPYGVELNDAYTVEEFIHDILLNKGEWGYIGINDGRSVFGDPSCKYSHGELKSSLPPEYLKLKVVSAKASGGWSRMDYLITPEVVAGEIFRVTDHYYIREEDIMGRCMYGVYENKEDTPIAIFRNRVSAMNECLYLERFQ